MESSHDMPPPEQDKILPDITSLFFLSKISINRIFHINKKKDLGKEIYLTLVECITKIF